jgi:nucleotide sugar dehydrogenase
MTTSVLNTPKFSIAPDGVAYPLPTPAEMEEVLEKIAADAARHRRAGRQVVAVQGLGFVGAAVAAVVANATNAQGEPLYHVIGVDLPSESSYWKIARINAGLAPIVSSDPQLGALIDKAVHQTRNLCAVGSNAAFGLADVIVVDVNLDVENTTERDPLKIQIGLDAFNAALRAVGRTMRADALVLIETTVPIGTCQHIAVPVLEEERAARKLDSPLRLAHAYERVMPGPSYVNSIRRYWRTFAGIDQPSAERARAFLSSFIDTREYPLWELKDVAASEFGKVLENSYRAMNIAFIHEWALLAEGIGVDLFEIVNSIRVRDGTHDNMRYPGFGVGGYCLTKDSLLAQWSATHLYGTETVLKTTLEALRINSQMPLHTFDLLAEVADGDLAGKTITVCGVSYLPDLNDTRNSPTEVLIARLAIAGAEVLVHDPHVLRWLERPETQVSDDLQDCLRRSDAVVFAVGHRAYLNLTPAALLAAAEKPLVAVDAQNILTDGKAQALHEAGWRLAGVGKGHWRKKGYQCLR